MAGYLLEYYQYIRYTEWSKQMLEEYINNKKKSYNDKNDTSFLTFGEFDRLRIRKIKEFSRFRDISEYSRKWAGKRTQLLLYEIENNPVLVFDEEKGKFVIKKNDVITEYQTKDPLFLGVTIMPIEDSVRRDEKSIYSEIVSQCKKDIQDIIKDLKKENIIKEENTIKFEVFGMLGTYGVAIVWLTDQYIDVLEVLNVLLKKTEEERVYFALNTIFSENLREEEFDRENVRINCIEGEARVRITTNKDSTSLFSKLNCLRKNSVCRCAGKYDFIAEMKANEVYRMFNKKGDFYYPKLAEKNILLQTEVDLLGREENMTEYEETDNNSSTISNQSEKTDYEKMLNEIEKNYNALRNRYKEQFPSETGMVDTLDLLYCDYFSNISASLNDIWAEDLSYQFLKTLDCLAELCECYLEKKIENDTYIEWVCSIMNSFKQQVFHIAESNKLYLDIPKCYLRYTGQQDVILYAWFGIIKKILKTIYNLKGNDWQSEIIPVITIDAIPTMQSRLYFEKGGTSSTRILNLYLPGSVLYDIPRYIPIVINELFHYAIPWDRRERNIYYGIIYVQEYLKTVFGIWIKKRIKNQLDDVSNVCEQKNMIIAQFIDRMNPFIYSYITETYLEQVHNVISNSEENEGELSCVNYFNRLWSYMTGNGLEKNVNDETSSIIFEKWCPRLICALKEKQVEIENQFKNGVHIEQFEDELQKEQILKIMETVTKTFFGALENPMQMFGELQIEGMKIPNQNRYLLVGLRKTASDIAMIEMTGMDVYSYLIFYTRYWNEKNISSESYNSKKALDEELRFGMTLEYFLQNDRDLKFENEQFRKKFIAHYKAQRLVQLKIVENDPDSEMWKKINEKIKEAGEIAAGWYEIYKHMYKNYLKTYGIYKEILERLRKHTSLKSRGLQENFREELEKYFDTDNLYIALDDRTKLVEALQRRRDSLFEINCKLIFTYQSQTTLKKIYEDYDLKKRKENEQQERKPIFFGTLQFADSGKKIEMLDGKKDFWEVHIEDLQNLLLSLRVYANRLMNVGKQQFPGVEPTLWYRGQSNVNKPLLPTLMRKEVGEAEQFHYLAQHQRHLFEQFKYMADGAPEMMSQGKYGISDYLALMQHYNSFTCLMDWTEDALSALFFAVEDYIVPQYLDNKKKNFTPGVVYLFNPSVYNNARRKIIRKCEKHNPDQSLLYKNTVKTATYDAGLLPNLSASYNEQSYDMFLLGNKDYETDHDYLSPDKLELEENQYGIFVPLAILTSRLNPRIRKQSGMFLAYNLYTKPSNSKEGRYDYMALEKVQEFYMKICKDTNPEPFLYKLVLENEDVKIAAASWVTAMGITKAKIYPELNNIGENSRKK